MFFPPRQRDRIVEDNVPLTPNLIGPGKVRISKMRSLALFSLAALCGTALAQTQGQDFTARQIMAEALGQLRMQTAFSVQMTGNETFDKVIVPTYVVAGFQRGALNATQTAWLEVRTYRDNVLTHRMAGDGENLWAWTARTNDYASSAYQAIGDSRSDFLSRLMSSSARWTSREADFAVRLIADIYLGSSAQVERWSPWIGMPTTTTVEIAERACTIYLGQSAQNAWLRYDLTRSEEGQPWQLVSVSYERQTVIKKKPEVITWTAEILPGVVPNDVSYTFLPPNRARPRATGGM